MQYSYGFNTIIKNGLDWNLIKIQYLSVRRPYYIFIFIPIYNLCSDVFNPILIG